MSACVTVAHDSPFASSCIPRPRRPTSDRAYEVVSHDEEVLLKECPSCHSQINESFVICPKCGFDFASDDDISKRTMMGIPGINAGALRAGAAQEEEPASRKTMFGLPATLEPSAPARPATLDIDDDEDDDDFAPTQVVSADFALNLDSDNQARFGLSQDVGEENALRSTAHGGLPSLKSMANASPKHTIAGGRPWGQLAEESSEPDEDEGSATVVASASLFEQDPRELSGFSKAVLHDKPKKHETLMGMTLDDLMPASKRTAFALPTPAFDAGDGLSEASEDEDDSAATQAISGAGVPFSDPPVDVTRERNRKRLLEKLRTNTTEERPARSTMFGIPGVSALQKKQQEAGEAAIESLPEFDLGGEVEESSRMTPNTGVLRVNKRKANQATEGAPPVSAGNTGVLGSSSYTFQRKEVTQDKIQPIVERSKPSLRFDPGLPIEEAAAPADRSADSTRVADPNLFPISAPVDDNATRVADGALVDQFQDLASLDQSEDENATRVVSAEMARLAQEQIGAHEQEEFNNDATREQSLSDIRQQLIASGMFPTVEKPKPEPVHHFSDDATRQQSVSDLRAQLGDGLFGGSANALGQPSASPPPIEAPPAAQPTPMFQPEVDVVPLEDDLFGAPPTEDDLFGRPPATPSGPLSIIDGPPPLNEPAPSLTAAQLFDSPAAPEPVLTPQPQPVMTPQPMPAPAPAPVPAPAPQPVNIPVEPLQRASAPKTITPQPGQQVAVAREAGGPGRLFQIVFGVLASLGLIGSTAAGFVTAAAPPAGAMLGMMATPAVLGVFTLICTFAPLGRARALALVFFGLAAFGVFGAGLALSGFAPWLVISCVGGLFGLAAAAFPAIAKVL